jgi:hypothetical protein
MTFLPSNVVRLTYPQPALADPEVGTAARALDVRSTTSPRSGELGCAVLTADAHGRYELIVVHWAETSSGLEFAKESK